MAQSRKADRAHAPRATGHAVPIQPAAGRGRPIALLVIAAALTVASLLELHAAWVNLPMPKLDALNPNAVVQAFRAARTSWTGDVRDGMLLAIISSHLTTALRAPDRLDDLYEDARNGYSKITGTQLARLQLTALAMLRLERDRVPLADWWAALAQFRAGLENASFNHDLPELLAANAAVYVQLGLGAGTARRSAQNVVGFPHGPFLEYFAAQNERMARSREQTGDAAGAAACRQLVRRLLRQWTLDPGPPSVRLLAAELLSNSLEADHAASAPAAGAEIVRGLRQWRDAYRTNAAQRPAPLPLLSNSYAPLLDPQAYDRLRRALAVLLWVAPALLAAGVITGLALIPWLRGAPAGAGLRAALLGGLLLSAVLLGAGCLYLQIDPGGALDDLRRLGFSDLGWPRYPFVSAAAACVLLVLVVLWPARGGKRVARLAAWATSMTIVLAMALLVAGIWTRLATAHYETRTAVLMDSGAFEAIAGAAADRDLAPLRAWTP
jgi:hypothetical protein